MAQSMSSRLPSPRQVIKGKYAVLVLIGVVGTVYHLWFARTYGIQMREHMILHLGLMMVAIPVIKFDPTVNQHDPWRSVIDNYLILPVELILSAVVTYYMFTNFTRLSTEALGIYTDADFYMGLLLIILIISESRRAFGNILPLVGISGLVYAIYGPRFPGILSHAGVSPRRLVTSQTVELVGVYDTLLQVAATFVVIFIIFAGFLEAFGAMNYFIQIGSKMGRYVRSGISQTAVVTSIGMGSINGSAAANAATTGAFTIPLMKSQGMSSDSSAAIESVASSGGQVMPPVMGAAAFIMAEITGVGYLTIIKIGLIPALLFYGTVVIAVHLVTVKENAGLREHRDMTEEEIDAEPQIAEPGTDGPTVEGVSLGTSKRPDNISLDDLEEDADRSLLRGILEGLYLWVPIGVLIYVLVILQYNPLTAGLWATLAVLPTALGQMLLLRNDYKQIPRDFVENTMEGCRLGITNAAPITLAVGVIAIFVGVLSLTGFTQLLAQSLVSLSGGSLVLLLFFAMVAAILFGLGMPTVAAYIVAVLLIAPALVNLGIRLETAHFFVFYFAVLSAITPPVAITCIITAEIAKGNFWRVSAKSLILGAPLFILPYVFVVNDALLYWTFPETAIVVPVILIGFICISVTLINYINGPLSVPMRLGLGAAGVLLLFMPLIPVVGNGVRVGLGGIALLVLYLFSKSSSEEKSLRAAASRFL